MNKEIALTKNEIQIINHSLGLDYKGKSFRNYFYTEEGTEDYPLCESLVNKGLMKKTKSIISPGYYYYVTDEGKKWVGWL